MIKTTNNPESPKPKWKWKNSTGKHEFDQCEKMVDAARQLSNKTQLKHP